MGLNFIVSPFAFIIGVALLGSGCSHLQADSHDRLTATHNIELTTNGSDEVIKFPANTRIQLRDDQLPAKISAPGRVPMLIVAPTVLDKSYVVSLPEMSDWKPQGTSEYLNQKLNDVTLQILQIVDDVHRGKNASAETRANLLVSAYPAVASGYYLRAEVALVVGKKDDAKALLKSAIGLRPDFQKAKQLLSEISGGNYPSEEMNR